MSEKLKPCPFCGSKWTQVRYINNPFDKNHVYGGYRGECTDCGVTTKSCLTKDEAIKLWNRRAERQESIEALEQEKTSQNLTKPSKRTGTHACDLISRQAAIYALRAMQTYKLGAGEDMLLIDQAEAQTELMLLPSAQPEIKPKEEIIRCKDCKHFNDGDCEELPKIVSETDFCSFAKRKEQ